MSDYISRKEAIARVCHVLADHICETQALHVLNEITAADVRPVVHGEWIECFEDFRQQIAGDKCSACGFEHYGTNISHYHFCPNCGADMRGEQKYIS